VKLFIKLLFIVKSAFIWCIFVLIQKLKYRGLENLSFPGPYYSPLAAWHWRWTRCVPQKSR